VSSVGHDLYRMLRAGMPPDWTAAERVVALILADICNDRTRTGFITNKQLCEESGLKPGSLRNILARLGDRGFEMRVELSEGRDGRPVYATSGRGRGGRAVDYRCPLLPPREAKGAFPGAPLGGAAVDNPPGGSTEGATRSAPLTERRTEECERRNEGCAPTPLTPQPSLPDQTSQIQVVTTSVEGGSGGKPRRSPAESAPRNLHPLPGNAGSQHPQDLEAERRRQQDELSVWIRDHPETA
jgi:hypothetical protein